MAIQFLKLNGNKFEDCDASEVVSSETPFYFYLGGMPHFLTGNCGEGLAHILNRLRGKSEIPVYTLYENSGLSFEAAIPELIQYSTDKTAISKYAYEIADLLFDKKNPTSEEAKEFYSRFNFIGNSLGCSFIQQIEKVLFLRYENNPEMLDALKFVNAVNIAPTTAPGTYNAPSNNDIADFGATYGWFEQVFFVSSKDKMIEKRTNGYYGAGDSGGSEAMPIKTYSNKSSLIVIDYSADNQIRRMGIKQHPSGEKEVRIQKDFEAHGHKAPLYMNTLEHYDGMLQIPNMASANAIMFATQKMGADNRDRTGFSNDISQALPRLIITNIKKIRDDFDSAAQAFISTPYQEAVETLSQYINSLEF